MTSDLDFATIRQFVLTRTGIQLTDEKRYLIETRLDPILRERGLSSLAMLAAKLRAGDTALENAVADAMTTNETLFFRDKGPFDITQNLILPKLIEAGAGSARSASGARPAPRARNPIRWRCSSTRCGRNCAGSRGRDRCDRHLGEGDRAGEGWRLQSVRGAARAAHPHAAEAFHPGRNRWRIRPELQREISFRRLNLLQPFQALGRFDIVFCRNVLIYFNDETKKDVLGRIAARWRPTGSCSSAAQKRRWA